MPLQGIQYCILGSSHWVSPGLQQHSILGFLYSWDSQYPALWGTSLQIHYLPTLTRFFFDLTLYRRILSGTVSSGWGSRGWKKDLYVAQHCHHVLVSVSQLHHNDHHQNQEKSSKTRRPTFDAFTIKKCLDLFGHRNSLLPDSFPIYFVVISWISILFWHSLLWTGNISEKLCPIVYWQCRHQHIVSHLYNPEDPKISAKAPGWKLSHNCSKQWLLRRSNVPGFFWIEVFRPCVFNKLWGCVIFCHILS